MSDNKILKRLGMEKEFDNWVKEQKTKSNKKVFKFEDIKIGDRFDIIGNSVFDGWRGEVTNKEYDTMISTLTSPLGETRKNMRTHKDYFEGHIRFI